MKKRNKISIFLIYLSIVILLVFLSCKYYFSEEQNIGYYDFEEANMQEEIVDRNRIIKEKNLNITMQIPEDWEYEIFRTSLIVKDPKMNVESPLKDFKEWTQGCSVRVYVEEDFTFEGEKNSIFEDEVERFNNLKTGNSAFLKGNSFDFLSLNGEEVLIERKEFEEVDFDGDIMFNYITILDKKNRRIYEVSSLLSTQVPQCEEYFNQFVNNLKI